jgi:L-lactate dehydrogenase
MTNKTIQKPSKVVVVGAGFVGATIALTLAIKQTCSELVLVDVKKEKAMGEALDICHGLPVLGPMKVYDGDYSDCAGADLIIITAGLNRKPGDTRLDLAQNNANLMKSITASIMQYYDGGLLLVVSNPVDVMTYLIQKWTQLPSSSVIGSGTLLDSSRFRYLISKRLDGVNPQDIHAYVIGEHGESQFPVWSKSDIGGINVLDYFQAIDRPLSDDDKEEVHRELKASGATIIKAKGVTNCGIAISVNNIVEALLRDTRSVRTLCSVLNGPCGLHDVALSLPCIIGRNGIEQVLDFQLNEEEDAQLKHSARQIRNVIDQITDV